VNVTPPRRPDSTAAARRSGAPPVRRAGAPPAPRFGAPQDAGVPRMEHVRVTAPDLARRAMMEKTRGRLVLAAAGFAVLFGAVTLKLADATVLRPVHDKAELQPRHDTPVLPPVNAGTGTPAPAALDTGPHAVRAMITDRNGEILAVSLPTAALYANPREMADPADAAHKLVSVLPRLDEKTVEARLADSTKQFVYLERQITPREELRINDLGIPGIYFQPTERRHYPLGRVAAQVLGTVDIDGHGVAGVEKEFEKRLREDPEPLRLSLDVRVQAVVREELVQGMADFSAIAGCGIVMDVHTGEVIAMVSLPDYDANDYGRATPDARRNRAVGNVYEPGSTFKLQNVSAALDDGVVHIWNGFDASSAIHVGRYTINDFEGKHRFLYIPEIIAYSSNIGAAHMADAVGPVRQRAWMQKMGMLSRIPIELPEATVPLYPPVANWKSLATMTIGFGQGIAVTPLHVVMGSVAVADGGLLRKPTILALPPDAPPPEGVRIMKPDVSDIVRKMMRLVVTEGVGKSAEVPGYFVGGKTGTAQKTGGGRGYKQNARVDAFMGIFPMQAPRYAVYMMLDEPKANASTHGFATAGWVVAPVAARVIARAAPMLGLLPDTEHAAEIDAELAMPLQPGRPAGAALPMAGAAPRLPTAPAVNRLHVPTVPALHDLRHEARYDVPDHAVR
jgi:cell division protein FtsI (penicillin-binding protein 3)